MLLQRARKIAAEHDQLSASLATERESNAARREASKRIGQTARVAAALREWAAARSSAAELAAMLESGDAELRQLAQDELASTHGQLEQLARNLSASLVPKHPFADMPCLVEVLPGPGGLEGRFFADSVFRMYQNYCTRMGFRARVVKYELADTAGDRTGMDGERGLQEAVLEVQDRGAYDRFRSEAGIHRVQRIPTTEKSGRTHTSAVAVWVLPSFPESADADGSAADLADPESDFYIDAKDVRTETMRARGPGGQHVNKTESAIRLTHVPTGTTVSMQDSRSQMQNRELAWRVLRSRIAQQRRDQREEMARNLRNSVLSAAQMSRADKIRTYNYSQDRCTDHRSGLDVHNLPDVLDGGDTLDRRHAERARVADREGRPGRAGRGGRRRRRPPSPPSPARPRPRSEQRLLCVHVCTYAACLRA